VRSALEALRLACDRHLGDRSVVGTRPQAVTALVQTLFAAVREPAFSEELTPAVEALLVHAGTQPACLVVLGRQHATLLPVPAAGSRWPELARDFMSAGYEPDLEALWGHEPDGLLTPAEGEEALLASLQTLTGADASALWAFTRWALDDARRRRARGVRGKQAFITIEEPRLREVGLSRVFLLRDTPEDITVRCDGQTSAGPPCGCGGLADSGPPGRLRPAARSWLHTLQAHTGTWSFPWTWPRLSRAR